MALLGWIYFFSNFVAIITLTLCVKCNLISLELNSWGPNPSVKYITRHEMSHKGIWRLLPAGIENCWLIVKTFCLFVCLFLTFALPSTSSLIELPNFRRRVGTNFSVRFRECQVYGGFCMLKTVVTHTVTQNSSVRTFFRQFTLLLVLNCL